MLDLTATRAVMILSRGFRFRFRFLHLFNISHQNCILIKVEKILITRWRRLKQDQQENGTSTFK
jgi:hypothetical protein